MSPEPAAAMKPRVTFADLNSTHETAMPSVNGSTSLRDSVAAYESGETTRAATARRIAPHCREWMSTFRRVSV